MNRHFLLMAALLTGATAAAQQWHTLAPSGTVEKRHENALAVVNDRLYLLGGRGERPVDEYDIAANTWRPGAKAPMEMHHFQAVTFKDEIYVLGAFTGPYPHETPIPDIHIYNPVKKEWRKGPALPAGRLRGAAGVTVHNNRIYLVCGIQDGHWDGHVAWLDEFNPETGAWKTLADAPHARDHLHAAVVDGKLYVAGGRLSSAKTGKVLNRTVGAVDVYDFRSNTWTTLDSTLNIPTKRAGAAAVAWDGKLVLLGGESDRQVPAHSEVEAYDPRRRQWITLPALLQGRHGTGAVTHKRKLYIAAGSANRGGGPELGEVEVYP
ncbi:MAG: galactose oxidase [Siphonobacter aquaeclarae]|nr:galactose oxidase [Siphonobacter aquaeclarae]